MPTSSAQAECAEASLGGLSEVQSASINKVSNPQPLSPIPIHAANALSEKRPASVSTKTNVTQNQKPHTKALRKRKRKILPQDPAEKKLKIHQDALSAKVKLRDSREPEYDTSLFIEPSL